MGTNLGYSGAKNSPNQLGDNVRPHHNELNASAEVDGDSERRVEVRATEDDRQYRMALRKTRKIVEPHEVYV